MRTVERIRHNVRRKEEPKAILKARDMFPVSSLDKRISALEDNWFTLSETHPEIDALLIFKALHNPYLGIFITLEGYTVP